jgi:hypothetical protein
MAIVQKLLKLSKSIIGLKKVSIKNILIYGK